MNPNIKFYNTLKTNNINIKDIFTKHNIISYLKMSLGTLLIAFSIQFLYTPTKLVTGGVGGIAIIIYNILPAIKESYTLAVGNILLLILAWFTLGKKYVYKTAYASILLPIIVYIFGVLLPRDYFLNLIVLKGEHVENLNLVIKLTVATLFGSVLTGVGLGIVINQNGSTGGMDIVQRVLNKYFKIPFSLAIYSTDGIITMMSMFIPEFQPITLVFSIIGLFLIGIVVDKYIFSGGMTFTVFIVTKEPEHLRYKILYHLQRSYTKVKVQGGYSNLEQNMLIVTIKKRQLHELRNIISKADKKAFSFIVETKEVVGYGFKNRD